MNIRNFINRIDFNGTDPIFPIYNKEIRETLSGPMQIPRMSSETIGGIINWSVFNMPDNACYLNIGTWCGFTLFAGMVNNLTKKCIGVDNFSESGGPEKEFMENFNRHKSPSHQFFKQDYREYFKIHTEPIGVYYYDGPHTYQDQLDGLTMAEKFFIDGAIIMVDDTNGARERKATFDFLSTHPLEYEIIADLPTPRNSHHTFHNGLIVLRKTVIKG